MYQRNKQASHQYNDDYRSGQSRTNFDYSQSQHDQSPQRRKQSQFAGSGKKSQQLANKIQDVIDLCVTDKNDGAQ